MKKLGLWLLRNNIHIMTFIFVCVTICAIYRWQTLVLIQKINLGTYFLLILHEYEEGYKNKFVNMFANVMGFDPTEPIKSGKSHIAQATAITILFILPMCFPEQLWLTFAGLILCIFEGFVHTMGIRLFRLGKPSPGWYTAIIMCAYAIWAIIYFGQNADYNGILWLWGALYFIGIFAIMQNCYLALMGSNITHLKNEMLAVAKKNLFKK